MLSDTEIYRTVLTHQQAVRQVRDRVKSFVTQYWSSMDSWRDADIAKFVETIVPVVEGGQRTIYRLTDAYMTTVMLGLHNEGSVAVPPIVPKAGPDIAFRGIPAAEVYLRPGTTVYTALSQGKPIEEAVKLGLYRLQDLIDTDMQLAQTHAARAAMSGNSNVVGYRRVLTGAENCALCAIASTQRYRKSDLMPIHPGCDCSVAPIIGDRDPGQVINEPLLRETQATLKTQGVQDTHVGTGDNKRDATNVMIRTHGEYGPTLSWRHQHFDAL